MCPLWLTWSGLASTCTGIDIILKKHVSNDSCRRNPRTVRCWDRNFLSFCFLLHLLKQGLSINPGWTWTLQPTACCLAGVEITNSHYHNQWEFFLWPIDAWNIQPLWYCPRSISPLPYTLLLHLAAPSLYWNNFHLPRSRGSLWLLEFWLL